MKRRSFIGAMVGLCVAPMAITKDRAASPRSRKVLSDDECDALLLATMERMRRASFEDLAKNYEKYMLAGTKCPGAPIGIDYWIVK